MAVTSLPDNAAATGEEAGKPRRLKKLALIVVAVLLIGGFAGWKFLAPSPTGPPEKGEVLVLESIQVNLDQGHYLKVGIALQLTTEASEHIEGSRALDAAIDLFSGLPLSRVSTPEQRRGLQEELTKQLRVLYDHEVMDVYFQEFVTQ